MFLSGSLAVTLHCFHQFDDSVPGLENLKRTKGMYQREILVFDTASTFQMFQVLRFSWHVLAVSPEFPQRWYTAETLPGHRKCTDLKHLWYIALVLFKFSKP